MMAVGPLPFLAIIDDLVKSQNLDGNVKNSISPPLAGGEEGEGDK